MAGLDPAIHHSSKEFFQGVLEAMDPRVKPSPGVTRFSDTQKSFGDIPKEKSPASRRDLTSLAHVSSG
jgi:hypothetical protein